MSRRTDLPERLRVRAQEISPWTDILYSVFVARKKDRGLAINVSREGILKWTAIAVETMVDAPSIAAVFDDHAHVVIGTWRTRREAQGHARAFAKKWLRHASGPLSCVCTPKPP